MAAFIAPIHLLEQAGEREMIPKILLIATTIICSGCSIPSLQHGPKQSQNQQDVLIRCDKLNYQCRQYEAQREAQRNAQQRAEIARQEQQRRRLGYATQNMARQACSQATGSYGYCSSGTELGSALFGF